MTRASVLCAALTAYIVFWTVDIVIWIGLITLLLSAAN